MSNVVGTVEFDVRLNLDQFNQQIKALQSSKIHAIPVQAKLDPGFSKSLKNIPCVDIPICTDGIDDYITEFEAKLKKRKINFAPDFTLEAGDYEVSQSTKASKKSLESIPSGIKMGKDGRYRDQSGRFVASLETSKRIALMQHREQNKIGYLINKSILQTGHRQLNATNQSAAKIVAAVLFKENDFLKLFLPKAVVNAMSDITSGFFGAVGSNSLTLMSNTIKSTEQYRNTAESIQSFFNNLIKQVTGQSSSTEASETSSAETSETSSPQLAEMPSPLVSQSQTPETLNQFAGIESLLQTLNQNLIKSASRTIGLTKQEFARLNEEISRSTERIIQQLVQISNAVSIDLQNSTPVYIEDPVVASDFSSQEKTYGEENTSSSSSQEFSYPDPSSIVSILDVANTFLSIQQKYFQNLSKDLSSLDINEILTKALTSEVILQQLNPDLHQEQIVQIESQKQELLTIAKKIQETNYQDINPGLLESIKIYSERSGKEALPLDSLLRPSNQSQQIAHIQNWNLLQSIAKELGQAGIIERKRWKKQDLLNEIEQKGITNIPEVYSRSAQIKEDFVPPQGSQVPVEDLPWNEIQSLLSQLRKSGQAPERTTGSENRVQVEKILSDLNIKTVGDAQKLIHPDVAMEYQQKQLRQKEKNKRKQSNQNLDTSSVGQNINEGIGQGLQENQDEIIDIAEDNAKKIKERTEEEYEIKSPSKWGVKVGEFINKGIGKGLEKMANAEKAPLTLQKKLNDLYKKVSINGLQVRQTTEADLEQSLKDLEPLINTNPTGLENIVKELAHQVQIAIQASNDVNLQEEIAELSEIEQMVSKIAYQLDHRAVKDNKSYVQGVIKELVIRSLGTKAQKQKLGSLPEITTIIEQKLMGVIDFNEGFVEKNALGDQFDERQKLEEARNKLSSLPDDKQKQLIVVTAGLAGAGGKAGDALAEHIQEVFDSLTIDNSDEKIGSRVGTAVVSHYNPGQDKGFGAESFAGILSGKYQVDAIALATKLAALLSEDSKLTVKLVGSSAGGILSRQAVTILNAMGYQDRVESIGLGSPDPVTDVRVPNSKMAFSKGANTHQETVSELFEYAGVHDFGVLHTENPEQQMRGVYSHVPLDPEGIYPGVQYTDFDFLREFLKPKEFQSSFDFNEYIQKTKAALAEYQQIKSQAMQSKDEEYAVILKVANITNTLKTQKIEGQQSTLQAKAIESLDFMIDDIFAAIYPESTKLSQEEIQNAEERINNAIVEITQLENQLNATQNNIASSIDTLSANAAEEVSSISQDYDFVVEELRANLSQGFEEVLQEDPLLKNLSPLLGVIRTSFTLATSFSSFIDFVRSSIETARPIMQNRLVIKGLSESETKYQSRQSFLNESISNTKTDKVVAESQYKNLLGSTKDTSLEYYLDDIFQSVSQASTALALDKQSQEGVFYAISQIASKGVVSMEELRQQLGERLPNAFTLGAKAMNLSTQEFIQLIESGKLLSTEFLPKFAETLRIDTQQGFETVKTGFTALLQDIENKKTNIQIVAYNRVLPALNFVANQISKVISFVEKHFQVFFKLFTSFLAGQMVMFGVHLYKLVGGWSTVAMIAQNSFSLLGKIIAGMIPDLIAMGAAMVFLPIFLDVATSFSQAIKDDVGDNFAVKLNNDLKKTSDSIKNVTKDTKNLKESFKSMNWFDDLLRNDGKSFSKNVVDSTKAGLAISAPSALFLARKSLDPTVPILPGILSKLKLPSAANVVGTGKYSYAIKGISSKFPVIPGAIAKLFNALLSPLAKLIKLTASLGNSFAPLTKTLKFVVGSIAKTFNFFNFGLSKLGVSALGWVSGFSKGISIFATAASKAFNLIGVVYLLSLAFNKLVSLFKGQGGKTITWSQVNYEKRLIKNSKNIEAYQALMGKNIATLQDYSHGKGLIIETQSIDKQIRQAGMKLAATPVSDKEGIKQIRSQLEALHQQRRTISADLIELKSQNASTIEKIKSDIAATEDPEVARDLQVQLSVLEKLNKQLEKAEGQFGFADAIKEFARALTDLNNGLTSATQNASDFIAIMSQSIAEKQFDTFSKKSGRFNSLTSATELAKVEFLAAEKTKQDQDIAVKKAEQILISSPVVPDITEILVSELNRLNIANSGADSGLLANLSLLQPEQIDSLVEQYSDATIKQVLEMASSLRKAMSESYATDQALAEKTLALKQAKESEILGMLDEKYNDQVSLLRLAESEKTAEIQRFVLNQTKSQAEAQVEISKIAEATAGKSVNLTKNKLKEIDQAYKRGEISTETYATKSREIEQQLADEKKQLIESQIALQEAVQQKVLDEMEKALQKANAKLEQSQNHQIAIIRKAQLDRKITEAQAEESLAQLAVDRANAEIQIKQKQLEELRKARAKGFVTESEFASRERDLITELSAANVQRLQEELALRNAIKERILDDLERANAIAEAAITKKTTSDKQESIQTQITEYRTIGDRVDDVASQKALESERNALLEQEQLRAIAVANNQKMLNLGLLTHEEYVDKQITAEQELADIRTQLLENQLSQQKELANFTISEIERAISESNAAIDKLQSQRSAVIKGEQLAGGDKSVRLAATTAEIAQSESDLDVTQDKLQAVERQIASIQDAYSQGIISQQAYNDKMTEAEQQLADLRSQNFDQLIGLQQQLADAAIAELERVVQVTERALEGSRTNAEIEIRTNEAAQTQTLGSDVAGQNAEIELSKVERQQSIEKIRLAERELAEIARLRRENILDEETANDRLADGQNKLAQLKLDLIQQEMSARRLAADKAIAELERIKQAVEQKLEKSQSVSKLSIRNIESRELMTLGADVSGKNAEIAMNKLEQEASNQRIRSVQKEIQKINQLRNQGIIDQETANQRLAESENSLLQLKIGLVEQEMAARRLAADNAIAELERVKQAVERNLERNQTISKIQIRQTEAKETDRLGSDASGRNAEIAMNELEQEASKNRIRQIEQEMAEIARLRDKGIIDQQTANDRLADSERSLLDLKLGLIEQEMAARRLASEAAIAELERVRQSAMGKIDLRESQEQLQSQQSILKGMDTDSLENLERQAKTAELKIQEQMQRERLQLAKNHQQQIESLRRQGLITEFDYEQRKLDVQKEVLDAEKNLVETRKQIKQAETEEILRQIDLQIAAEQRRINELSAAADAEKALRDHKTKMLDFDKTLMDARSGLESAKSNAVISKLQIQIEETDDPAKKAALQNELHEAKIAQLEREYQIQLQQLNLDKQRNQIAAEQLVAEAEINKLKAESARLEAQMNLSKAQATKDAEQIAIARSQLNIANKQAQIADLEIAAAQRNLEVQTENYNILKETLNIQHSTAMAEAEAAKRADSRAAAYKSIEDSANGAKSAMEQQANISRQVSRQIITNPVINGIEGDIEPRSFGGFRAKGGPVGMGKSYVVGEKGPELFIPSGSGTIIPNSKPTPVNSLNTPGAGSGNSSNKEISSRLDTLNNRIVQLANSPRNISVSTATPVSDTLNLITKVANTKYPDV